MSILPSSSTLDQSPDRAKQFTLIVWLLITALTYFIAARIGIFFTAQPEGLASIWPASGVALAALILRQRKDWGWILATIFIVNVASNLSGGNALSVSLAFALADTLEPTLGAWLMVRFIGNKITFARLPEVAVLFGVATVSNGITAIVGALVPATAFGAPYWNTWLVWWIGDGLGIILITPFIVTWLNSPNLLRSVPPRHILEAGILFPLALFSTWVVFYLSTQVDYALTRPYLLFPFLLWVGVRFTPRGVTLLLVLLSAISLWHTLLGYDAFGLGHQPQTLLVLNTQVYLIISAFSGLVLTAIITERQRAEYNRIRAAEIVRKREEELRQITENMVDLIAKFDAQAFFQYISPSYEKVLGYRPDDLLGTFAPDLMHPDEKDAMIVTISSMLKSGTGLVQFRYRHKNGSYRWFESSGRNLTDANGQIIGSILGSRDVTESKQAEEVLKETNIKLGQAQRIAQIGSWEDYLPTGELHWSEEMYHILGLPLNTPVNLSQVSQIFPPEEMERFGKAVNAAINEGMPYSMDYRIIRPNGSERYIHDEGVVKRDEQGNAIWMFGTTQDITARKQAEEEIRRLNAELEQRVIERTAQLQNANKELEAFSYTVSHDLRAPLRAIDGFARILAEDHLAELTDEPKRYLQRVRDNVILMGQLIDDLLAFSRLSRQSLVKQNIDTEQLVRRILEELSYAEANRQIEISIGELPGCQADPALLRQVWINLISNALKFTHQRQVARIEIGSLLDGGEPVYFIRDNGIGFDMQYAHKLFGVFQRLHRAEEYEGTGVGLAIVQRIIHRHGGRVWAEAGDGVGATFYFTL